MLVVGYMSLIGKGKLTIILYLFNSAQALIATVSSYLQNFYCANVCRRMSVFISGYPDL
jgi:hypothetical protein